MIKSFQKQYGSELVIVDSINSDKRIILLKGDNGSAKSTLLKAMMGLIKYNGTIDLNGTKSYMNEVIHFPKDARVKDVIDAYNIIDRLSHQTLFLLIDQFDLTNKVNYYIHSLSKGMKMKLQLICTFMLDRDIYILDEPFSGLDHPSVIALITYIKSSSKQFIIASHIGVELGKDCEVILL
jgi:ABC-type multidrug transport system ATPase subunit